jgi:hypothetical protein
MSQRIYRSYSTITKKNKFMSIIIFLNVLLNFLTGLPSLFRKTKSFPPPFIEGNSMAIDHSTLTKGQIRKLNALRKSVGDDIAEDAFGKWMKSQSKTPKEVRDPVADALVVALANLKDDKNIRLGGKGYVVRRARGKGASGFVAQKFT